MLSVLIVAQDGEEERLARTLAFLVPAAVEGAVREVIVIAPEAAQGVAAVAEHAGCRSVSLLAQGIGAARSEWLLFLQAGGKLSEGWLEEISRHLGGKGDAARFTPEPRSWLGAFRVFTARRTLSDGLLISRREAVALTSAGQAASDFARRVKARRLRTRVLSAL